MAYVVDHIVPTNFGGTDDLDNKQAAHAQCNRAKWDKLEADMIDHPRVFVTERTW